MAAASPSSAIAPPDLVRRIFLEEMDPRDRHLGLRWQLAADNLRTVRSAC
jgi:hypothetical protein